MRRLRAKQFIEALVGPRGYWVIRARGMKIETRLNRFGNYFLQRIVNRSIRITSPSIVMRGGVAWSLVKDTTLAQALEADFLLVSGALSESGVTWWLVKDATVVPVVIGVDATDRERVFVALASLGSRSPVYAFLPAAGSLLRHVSTIIKAPEFSSATVLRILEPRIVKGSALSYGRGTGCEIEFWGISENGQAAAPRENRASRFLSAVNFALVPATVFGHEAKTPTALAGQMLDDVVFPVDAVYTWVDGEDPQWLESKRRVEAQIAGVEYHSEANHVARFRSRDELKYSLRSLEMYAPWFRTVFIVTAGQVPDWLNTDHPRIKLVDHSEIYPDTSYLPTFNSNSIISRLHHIEGLSEHYVYINDDVFFGRPLGKDKFFLASGIAKVSRSNNRRPFGESSAGDEPHLNLTRNIRSMLESEFGVTISRAIKHTPHPQLKSVHFEMEAKFPDVYEKTWASRFRHHEDIVADQLHHYYAQIVGKAIPASLRYNYINVLDDHYRSVMRTTLEFRRMDSFCVNDAPVQGATPITDGEVNDFLEKYFPVKSTFEK